MIRLKSFLIGLVDLFVGLAEIIIGLRFILRLFAANPDAAFVHWLYDSSATLLQPFRGIFPPGQIGHGHVLDTTALFGMLVYALFGLVIMWIIEALTPEPAPQKPAKHK